MRTGVLTCHMKRFTQQNSCDHHMTKNPERKHTSLAAPYMKNFETNELELIQIFKDIVN